MSDKQKTYFDLEVYHYHEGEFDYIDSDKIPEPYRTEFWDWMCGQTMPLIDDFVACVYLWDFERWYELRFHGTPTYFD